jgi:diguanylate cyclase (GGDEF)-like protein/PAS domain S-box-containing protein
MKCLTFFDEIKTSFTLYHRHRHDFLAHNIEFNCRILAFFSLIIIVSSSIWLVSALFFGRNVLLAFPLLFWSLLVYGLRAFVTSQTDGLQLRLKSIFIHIALAGMAFWVMLYFILSGHTFSASLVFFSGYILVSSLFLLHPLFLVLVFGSGVVLFSSFGAEVLLDYRMIVAFGIFGLLLSFLRLYDSFSRYQEVLQVRENKARAELALEGAKLGYWNWTVASNLIEVDQRWFTMIERQPEKEISIDAYFSIIHPEDRKRVAKSIQDYFEQRSSRFEESFRMETGTGTYRWICSRGMINERSEDGSPLAMHGVHQDVHQNILQRQQLEKSEARFRTYIEHSPVAVFVISGRRIIYANHQAADLTGYCIEELLSLPDLYVLIPKEMRPELKARMTLFKATGIEDPEMVFQLQTREGERIWAEGRSNISGGAEGELLLSLVDITSRHEAELRLESYATYDELTGAYNRRVGFDLLEKELFRACREGQSLAIGFVDIDGLKDVNDNLGHEAGDRLIVVAAESIKRVLRRGDLICRMGGDEFLLVHPDCSLSDAEQLWNRIEKEFVKESSTDGRFTVSASAGFSTYKPESPGEECEQSMADLVVELVREADERMYCNKRKRKAQSS